jgi:hypothetical protein
MARRLVQLSASSRELLVQFGDFVLQLALGGHQFGAALGTNDDQSDGHAARVKLHRASRRARQIAPPRIFRQVDDLARSLRAASLFCSSSLRLSSVTRAARTLRTSLSIRLSSRLETHTAAWRSPAVDIRNPSIGLTEEG